MSGLDKPEEATESVTTKPITASSTLDVTNLTAAFSSMHEQSNPPVKVLTPVDFKRRDAGTFMGMPVVVDPLLPSGEVLVEYRNGLRERLNRISVIDLATTDQADTTDATNPQ